MCTWRARLAARWIKASLHKTGSWQHGFISGDLAQQHRPDGNSRHFAIWARPVAIVPGWTRAARVVVPALELQACPVSGAQRGRGAVAEIPVCGAPAAAIIEIWLEARGSRGLRLDARLVGQLRQAGGGNVWVTARELQLPWDPRQRYANQVAAARAAAEAELQAAGQRGSADREVLSICIHDAQVPDGELILWEMAVPLANPRP